MSYFAVWQTHLVAVLSWVAWIAVDVLVGFDWTGVTKSTRRAADCSRVVLRHAGAALLALGESANVGVGSCIAGDCGSALWRRRVTNLSVGAVVSTLNFLVLAGDAHFARSQTFHVGKSARDTRNDISSTSVGSVSLRRVGTVVSALDCSVLSSDAHFASSETFHASKRTGQAWVTFVISISRNVRRVSKIICKIIKRN